MELQIIYEDDNLLVINKPAGLMVHPDGRTTEITLVDWLVKKYPQIKNVGEPIRLANGEQIEKSGVVHRLDRETSGALVVAKNQTAFIALKNQFKNRQVKKTYLAVVYGELKNEQGIINRPIARSRRNFKQWSAEAGSRGTRREAVTEYKVLGRHNDLSLLEVYPKTGRTHQIRVHLKAIHHPLVGDKLYVPKREGQLGFKRLALHAFKIVFTDLSGQEVSVTAPYPADFQEALKTFGVV